MYCVLLVSSSRIKHRLKYFTAYAGLHQPNARFSKQWDWLISGWKRLQRFVCLRWRAQHKEHWWEDMDWENTKAGGFPRWDWTPAQVWWEKAASDGGALWGRRRLVVIRLHRREQQHLLGKKIYRGEKVYFPPAAARQIKGDLHEQGRERLRSRAPSLDVAPL